MLELGLPDDQFQAHHAAHISIMEEVAQLHLDAMYGKKSGLTRSHWHRRQLGAATPC